MPRPVCWFSKLLTALQTNLRAALMFESDQWTAWRFTIFTMFLRLNWSYTWFSYSFWAHPQSHKRHTWTQTPLWKPFKTLTCTYASHQGSNPARYHRWKNKHELILLNAKSNRGCQQLHYPSNPVQTASVKPNGLPELAKMFLLRFFFAPRIPLSHCHWTLPLTGIES